MAAKIITSIIFAIDNKVGISAQKEQNHKKIMKSPPKEQELEG